MSLLRSALALLPVLLLSSPVTAQEPAGLTVQTRWRLGAIGLDADPRLDLDRTLRRTARAIERELPGLSLEVAAPVVRRRLPASEGTPPTNGELAAAALGLAEDAGVDWAACDVVFVFTPHVHKRYLGIAHVLPTLQGGGSTPRVALIHTRPFALLYRSLLDTLAGRTLPGFQAEEPLPPEVAAALERLLALLGPLVERLGDLPAVRERLIEPTLAHEFGHFLAPGDRDVKDGYQEPWLRHATGERDNPDGHALDCCMYKGRGLRFYLQKALATRGRLVRFCEPCRERLGCPRAPRRALF